MERGEEVVITTRGKPVARRIQETGAADRDQALRAVAAMMELRKGVTLAEGLTVKDLIEEGRR